MHDAYEKQRQDQLQGLQFSSYSRCHRNKNWGAFFHNLLLFFKVYMVNNFSVKNEMIDLY